LKQGKQSRTFFDFFKYEFASLRALLSRFALENARCKLAKTAEKTFSAACQAY
jgi:hypothetical protein